ncbi:hypothetical protein HYH03_017766 [Edaphochlamys debaryana]|uniref:Peptidase S8/S53 domain-containing protein n=1 Tax=Edaphochlamys debaryana TaxID=47281 RepID=A0A835XHV8_9CHLO|nr:hypothetical protein HYH03_017766 [Edaphochlamys debaryana]|eukprot:KAG2483367.1 hypothetical protein HYH03_017766 [Edaphochlamys debaryana]
MASEDVFNATITSAGCSPLFYSLDAGVAGAVCPSGVILSTATPGFAALGVDLVVPDDDENSPYDTEISFPATTADLPSSVASPSPAAAGGARRSAQAAAGFYTGALNGSGVGQPNDPTYPYQWAPHAIGAPAAWARGINGRCVRVAILDGASQTQAIIYAAQRKNKGGAGADMINLSWALRYNRANATKFENNTQAEGQTAMGVYNKVFAYANKNGVLIVGSASNL